MLSSALQRTRRQVERDGPGGMTKLFSYVSPDVFKRPTYLKFYNLLDNYNRELAHAAPETGAGSTSLGLFPHGPAAGTALFLHCPVSALLCSVLACFCHGPVSALPRFCPSFVDRNRTLAYFWTIQVSAVVEAGPPEIDSESHCTAILSLRVRRHYWHC